MVLNAWKGAKEIVKNYSSTMKTAPMQKKLAEKMMEKEYPSYTVTGQKTYEKRKDETLKTIKSGNMVKARENLKKLKEQFKKDNPEYK